MLTLRKLILAVAVCATVGAASSPMRASSSGAVVEFPVTIDGHVNVGEYSNWASETLVVATDHLGSSISTLIHFDLGLASAGKTTDSHAPLNQPATLELVVGHLCQSDTHYDLGVHLITEPWDPDDIVQTGLPAAERVGGVRLLSPEGGARARRQTGTRIRLDGASLLEAWQGGEPNHGILLSVTSYGFQHSYCGFASSETGLGPTLVSGVGRYRSHLPSLGLSR